MMSAEEEMWAELAEDFHVHELVRLYGGEPYPPEDEAKEEPPC